MLPSQTFALLALALQPRKCLSHVRHILVSWCYFDFSFASTPNIWRVEIAFKAIPSLPWLLPHLPAICLYLPVLSRTLFHNEHSKPNCQMQWPRLVCCFFKPFIQSCRPYYTEMKLWFPAAISHIVGLLFLSFTKHNLNMGFAECFWKLPWKKHWDRNVCLFPTLLTPLAPLPCSLLNINTPYVPVHILGLVLYLNTLSPRELS